MIQTSVHTQTAYRVLMQLMKAPSPHHVHNVFSLQVLNEKNESIKLNKVANKQRKTQTDQLFEEMA